MLRDTINFALTRWTMFGQVKKSLAKPKKSTEKKLKLKVFATKSKKKIAPAEKPELPGTEQPEPPGTVEPEPPGTVVPPVHPGSIVEPVPPVLSAPIVEPVTPVDPGPIIPIMEPVPPVDPGALVEPVPPVPKKSTSIAGLEGNWNRYEVAPGVGYLVYNSADKSMSAHCLRHGGRCRAPKVLKKKPLGYYLLWLQRGQAISEGPKHAGEHLDLRLRGCTVSFRFVSSKS